jgi:tRNA 2-thiouridine synthesizing protein A
MAGGVDMEAQGVTASLDMTGFFCPEPIIRVNQEMAHIPIGDVLELLADDPSSESDIASWARRTGNELLSAEHQDGHFRFLIRRAS